MRKAKAFIVICPHRPDLLGQPLLGHVGWGYEYPNGDWCIGAVEGPEWGADHNGFWASRKRDLRSALLHFSGMKNRDAEYDYYKLLTVSDGVEPNPDYADQLVRWVQQEPYNLFGRNCMNSAYDILKAFADAKFNGVDLPHPATNWIPNGWFNAIQTNEYYKLPKAYNAEKSFEEENIMPFDLDGDLIAPEWRKPGAELFIKERSPEETVEIKVPEPMGIQTF